MLFCHCHVTIVQRTEIKIKIINVSIENATSYHGESNLTFEGFAWQQNCRTGSLTILMGIWNLECTEGVNGMDLPSESVSREQLRGWCPIMVSKICTNSPQCSSNDKYFQQPLLIDGSITKCININILRINESVLQWSFSEEKVFPIHQSLLCGIRSAQWAKMPWSYFSKGG